MHLTKRPTPAGRMGRKDNGVSAPFGYSKGYRDGKYMHHGQDYYWLNADPSGSRKVYATGAGTVTKVAYDSTMGQCITIDHGDFNTRSCHMPKSSAKVKVGDKVTDKTYLGPMGNAGTAALGQFHLHFEVWKNGTRVDPEPYFHGSDTAGTGDKLKLNQRQVLSNAFTNKRAEATSKSELKGTAAAKSIVSMTGWKRGEKNTVGKVTTDVWFTDGKTWMWAGGFTDAGTHDLTDMNPVVVPPDPEPTPDPDPEPTPDPEPEPTPDPEPTPPVDPETPNWFVRFIQAIIEALAKFLGSKRQ